MNTGAERNHRPALPLWCTNVSKEGEMIGQTSLPIPSWKMMHVHHVHRVTPERIIDTELVSFLCAISQERGKLR
jgi:hypothetical protein